jgi:hypothetical protein
METGLIGPRRERWQPTRELVDVPRLNGAGRMDALLRTVAPSAHPATTAVAATPDW